MSYPSLDINIVKELPKLVAHYRKPSFKKAILQIITSFGPFLGLLILMYLIGTYEWLPLWTLIPFGLVNAFFLVRIFIIQHDCGHQSFTPSKKRNQYIGIISSMFSSIPYQYRAKGHSFHHNHANKLWEHRDIGEIMTYSVQEYKNLSLGKKIWYRIFRSTPFMLGIIPTRYIIVQCRIPSISLSGWGKERRSLLRSNILIVGLYTAIALLVGRKIFLMTNGIILLFFAIIAIWFFYIQHQYEFGHKAFEDKREYIRAAIEGSSFYDLPKFWHWMTGNIGYHHIHHLNSSVPSYELARCFQENKILQDVARRLTFTKSLESLWCHLWDETQEKMISFKEYYRRYDKNNK